MIVFWGLKEPVFVGGRQEWRTRWVPIDDGRGEILPLHQSPATTAQRALIDEYCARLERDLFGAFFVPHLFDARIPS